MRLMQHKKEAYFFYRFLSIFYDKIVNPLFWTKKMRDDSLSIAALESNNFVIDVGSGTGFTTEGIVKHVSASQVICVDQSPHQMAKAKNKDALQGCHFQLGDAENIPFKSDSFDRYVSAGSIEYWPDPQKGITEAYRIIKPGGRATLIGPLEPPNFLARFIANTWMLFPKDAEYKKWYKNAGFEDIEVKYTAPHWIRKKEKYCIAISGTKSIPGPSKFVPPIVDQKNEISFSDSTQKDTEGMSFSRTLILVWRVLIGSLAGFLFIPLALFGYIRSLTVSQKDLPEEYREGLNGYQWVAILLFIILLIFIAKWIF